jgi:thiol reductant ABC exporter CydC subunit
MKQLVKLIYPQIPSLLIAGVVSGISLSMSVGLLATSAWLISMASTRPPILVLEVAIVAVRFFGLGRGVVRYYSRIREHDAALTIQNLLRQRIYSSIAGGDQSELLGIRRGKLVQQIGLDSELLQDIWLRILLPWISSLIAGVSGIGILMWLAPDYSRAIAGVFITAMTFIPLVAILAGSQKEQENLEKNLSDEFAQSCDALEESLIFGNGSQVIARIEQLQSDLVRKEIRSSFAAGITEFLHYLFLGTSVVLGFIYSNQALSTKSLAGINVAVLVLIPLAIFDGLPMVFSAFTQWRVMVARVKNLQRYFLEDLTDEICMTPNESTLRVSELVPSTVKGRIKPLTFELIQGVPLVISGRSGSGKSSIIHAITGFIKYEGRVEVGGTVAALLQSDHLFMTSIRENLNIAREGITESEMWKVLEICELESLIKSLPDGLDTYVGEYGYNFSGGEKQRIKLARLLLTEADIYLLDEPFEFLDPSMSHRLEARISNILAVKRLLIVSHLPIRVSGRELTLQMTA